MLARNNPFRTARIGGLAFRPLDETRQACFARLCDAGVRGVIVGPHGSGKTTLLRELGREIEGRGRRVVHWFLNEEVGRPPLRSWLREARTLRQDDVLLFDGAGHLPYWSWSRVALAARRAGGIVITSHTEGRLPTLVETRTDDALLDGLLLELMGPRARELGTLAEELRKARSGNLREVFLDLYDLAARDDPRLTSLA